MAIYDKNACYVLDSISNERCTNRRASGSIMCKTHTIECRARAGDYKNNECRHVPGNPKKIDIENQQDALVLLSELNTCAHQMKIIKECIMARESVQRDCYRGWQAMLKKVPRGVVWDMMDKEAFEKTENHEFEIQRLVKLLRVWQDFQYKLKRAHDRLIRRNLTPSTSASTSASRKPPVVESDVFVNPFEALPIQVGITEEENTNNREEVGTSSSSSSSNVMSKNDRASTINPESSDGQRLKEAIEQATIERAALEQEQNKYTFTADVSVVKKYPKAVRDAMQVLLRMRDSVNRGFETALSIYPILSEIDGKRLSNLFFKLMDKKANQIGRTIWRQLQDDCAAGTLPYPFPESSKFIAEASSRFLTSIDAYRSLIQTYIDHFEAEDSVVPELLAGQFKVMASTLEKMQRQVGDRVSSSQQQNGGRRRYNRSIKSRRARRNTRKTARKSSSVFTARKLNPRSTQRTRRKHRSNAKPTKKHKRHAVSLTTYA